MSLAVELVVPADEISDDDADDDRNDDAEDDCQHDGHADRRRTGILDNRTLRIWN